MTLHIFYFIIQSLVIVAGFKLYDIFRTRWEYAFNQRKERYSKIWHACGFWTVALTVSISAIGFLPLDIVFRFFPLASVFVWIVYDIAWNLTNERSILYAGNGGGSFLEMVFSWLTKKFGFDLRFWSFISKFLLFVFSLIWAFKHNL